MFKRICISLVLAGSALMSLPAQAERFPEVLRPIDYFIHGDEILAVDTLRDTIRAQGNFPLGKALFTIGRTDLLGLNRSLDSFDTGTLETPLGGNFEVDREQMTEFRTARAQRARQAQALRERLQTTVYEREREHLALDHHAIVSIADRDGNITYANDLFCQISGYERHEVLGQSHRMLTIGQQEPGFMRAVWRSISAGKVWHGEICSRRKDGSRYWVESTITPFLDSAGEMYQFVAIQTDISHIKATEAALRTQRDTQGVISLSAAALMAAGPGQTHAALAQALQQSGQRLQADRAYLYTFSRDGLHMNNAQVWNAPGVTPLSPQATRIPLDRLPWMRERFLQQEVLQIADVMAMPDEARSDQAVLRNGRLHMFDTLEEAKRLYNYETQG